MYCQKCGVQSPEDASYCYKCGTLLYREAAESRGPQSVAPSNRPGNAERDNEERRLTEELSAIDPKLHECHACGARESLHSWNFALGKVLRRRRSWGGTVASLAVSSVTIPLFGIGVLHVAGKKKVRLRVLRMKLILCGACRAERMAYGPDGVDRAAYALHPWWTAAQRLKYTEFLNAADLSRLEPAR